jgi:hypothetical protein
MIGKNIDWMFDKNFFIKDGKWTHNNKASKKLIKQFKLFFRQENEK